MTMRRVAVTGATGRIGAPLVGALLAAGIEVRALSRGPAPAGSGATWVQGDMNDSAVLAELVQGVDTLFHAGGLLEGDPDAIYRSLVDGTEAVLEATRSIRLIYLSSLVVLDTGSKATTIHAGSPLEPAAARRGIYTRAKVDAEGLVRAAAANQAVVIVRPGLVIVDGDNPMPPSVALKLGPCWLPVGPASAELPVVHADALATALISAARAAPPGAVLHVVDQPATSREALFRRLRSRDDSGLVLPVGSLLLAVARLASPLSAAAYRLTSAAEPHRWTPS